MTHQSEQIAVSQAAREAAHDLMMKARGYAVEMPNDGHFALQAFARFEAETLERAAKVAEGLRREVPYEYNQPPHFATMRRIATAIRALKGSGHG